jgi:hypothetical protein
MGAGGRPTPTVVVSFKASRGGPAAFVVEIGAEMNASARACTVTVCRIIERHGGSFTHL